MMATSFLALLAPAALVAAALAGFACPGRRPKGTPLFAELASLAGLAAALACVALTPWGGAPAGGAAWGLAPRLDAVSVTMLVLVAFIGWVVVRYTATYLDGEDRQGEF